MHYSITSSSACDACCLLSDAPPETQLEADPSSTEVEAVQLACSPASTCASDCIVVGCTAALCSLLKSGSGAIEPSASPPPPAAKSVCPCIALSTRRVPVLSPAALAAAAEVEADEEEEEGAADDCIGAASTRIALSPLYPLTAPATTPPPMRSSPPKVVLQLLLLLLLFSSHTAPPLMLLLLLLEAGGGSLPASQMSLRGSVSMTPNRPSGRHLMAPARTAGGRRCGAVLTSTCVRLSSPPPATSTTASPSILRNTGHEDTSSRDAS